MARAFISNNVQTVTVDVADNSTTVHAGPCRLWGIHVNTSLSAHDLPIKDDTTQKIVLPASAAQGSNYQFWRAPFKTSLIVDPNDAATGNITVMYEPL